MEKAANCASLPGFWDALDRTTSLTPIVGRSGWLCSYAFRRGASKRVRPRDRDGRLRRFRRLVHHSMVSLGSERIEPEHFGIISVSAVRHALDRVRMIEWFLCDDVGIGVQFRDRPTSSRQNAHRAKATLARNQLSPARQYSKWSPARATGTDPCTARCCGTV